ncbi:MAG TPA: hypothetical protein VMI31_07490 [Fimbriimonadaceae bacterium]|nr:hypothetical protein [Fimbriimonadaceae bacterium]
MMRHSGAEGDLIAPHEMRELLSRLTESSVESIRPSEPRTLAGIALDTGIPIEKLQELLLEIRGRKHSHWPLIAMAAVLILAALWIATRRSATVPAASAPVARTATIDEEGLVALSAVRYGPSEGPLRVDPGFSPPKPLPAGIAIAAQIGPVVWGAGDRYGQALHTSPSATQTRSIQSDIEALIAHARLHASRRRLPFSEVGGDSGLIVEGPGDLIQVSIEASNVESTASLRIPPSGQGSDAEIRALVHRASNLLIERLRFEIEQNEKLRHLRSN